MTRINTNLPALMSALHMNRNMAALNKALERMASGIRLNSAKDDPEGIIVSEVLRGNITGINDAISNTERASNLISTADSSIGKIEELLLETKQILVEAANHGALTDEELANKQVQVDNNINAINSVAESAAFAGLKLLDGSLGYTTSGVDSGSIEDMAIHNAPIGADRREVPILTVLQASAERGELIFDQGAVASDLTLAFSGPGGSETLEFVAGTGAEEMVQAINAGTGRTGLTAELINAGDPSQGFRVQTERYGQQALVKVNVVAGNAADFALEDAAGAATMSDRGVDIQANVNGTLVTGNGLNLHYVNASTDLEVQMSEAFNNGGAGQTTDFVIDGGGALFQLGAKIDPDQQSSFGIAHLGSANLGWSDVGTLDEIASGGSKSLTSGRLSETMAIVEAAKSRVTATRARLGSFQANTLKMTSENLSQSLESVSTARSRVLDTDYAVETANMVRQQILVDATRSVMSLANSVPQHVLQLLIQ